MSRDVFISYKTEDKEAADRLCTALEGKNISCWIAPRDIPPGKAWAAAIVDGIQSSKNFVLLLSSHSSAAKQISREAELADTQNIPIVTFRLEDVKPPNDLLYFLGNLQWLDGFGDRFESSASRLADVIRGNATLAEIPKAPAAATPAAGKRTNPYLVPAGAALLIVIAIGAWLALRGSRATTNDMQDAKSVADRLLLERDSGDYDAAWGEYTAAFRDHESRANWQESNQKLRASRGGIAGHELQSCEAAQGGYVCNYLLVFKNGSRLHDELWLVRNERNGWSINKGRVFE